MTQNEAQDRFFQHIANNIRYWLQQTRDLSQRDVAELDADRQNIFQAIQYGLMSSQTWPLTAKLVLQCWMYIERRGFWHDWIPVLEQVIEQVGDTDRQLKGQLLNRLGQTLRLDRQWSPAVTCHQQAKEIAEEIGDELMAAQTSYYLCSVYTNSQRFKEAEPLGMEALAAFTRIAPDSFWIGAAHQELGLVALWRGELETAERRFSFAVERWRQVDDRVEVGNSLINLALTLQMAGRVEEALIHYQEAIGLLDALGSKIRKILAQTNMGALYHQRGEYEQAEETFRQVDLTYLRQVGNLFFQAVVAQSLGTVTLDQGRLNTAEHYLRQSYELWSQLDDEINLANALGGLAEVNAIRGNSGEAIALYEEARQLLADFPDHIRAQRLLNTFSEAVETMSGEKVD